MGMNEKVATEPTEIDELSERVLGLIAAYAAGAVLDADELQRARGHALVEAIRPGEAGYLEDGIYHVEE